ncbi:MAG: aldo/keto reductase [Eubacteriales bacterium]|nr:aldo/keto reductase [Lachnospiraceae bacterium]MDO5126439.1 aldo/keto reductase [Eubacteriales bacterium]
MQYRKDKYGNDISILGYGCMRFTKKGKTIDFEKAEREILHGIELGINYYDTAYVYPGNEECLGRILAKNGVRDKVKIATKLPQYLVKSPAAIDRYFNEELKRLQTDYIDYYLMHMITDIESWENLKKNGILSWIEKHKADGSIRQVGFSYHGNTDMFLKVLDAYDWDFCQIQYNYIDEHTQAGRKGLDAAAKKRIPVIIMEPLRGGKLVNMLPERAKKLIASHDKKRSPAEWGLRWLWEQPEVTCVLSGMNSIEMLDENARIASEVQVHEFEDGDRAMIEQIKAIINEKTKVPCTACGYCMPCPQNVDIPGTFCSYNTMYTEGKAGTRFEYARMVGIRKDSAFASQCIGCGKCEKHCPQGIEIRKMLKEADKKLRPLPYKIGVSVAKKYMMWGKKKREKK